MRRHLLLVCTAALVVGCGKPPEKEVTTKERPRDSVVHLYDLAATPPADWEEKTPKSDMGAEFTSSYHFALPRYKGDPDNAKDKGDPDDAQLRINLRTAAGTSVDASIGRWIKQFQAPEGAKLADLTKQSEMKIGLYKAHRLEITGDQALQKVPEDPVFRSNIMLVGIVIEGPVRPAYITLRGPRRTVEHHLPAFEKWLQSFKPRAGISKPDNLDQLVKVTDDFKVPMAKRPTRPVDKAKPGEVSLDGLTSKPPATWVPEKPTSAMRLAQFRLASAQGDGEDAEVVIFHRIGGSAEQNVKRWRFDEFKPPVGKKIEDVSSVKELEVAGCKVTYLDVEGTYKSMAGPQGGSGRPGTRMIGVHFEGPQSQYHILLRGPARTVTQHKPAFDQWLKSFE